MNYDEIIDELLADLEGDFVVAVEAQKLVARMVETAPDVLDAWLHERAASITTDVMTYRLGKERRSSRRCAPVSEFADAARNLDTEDDHSVAAFQARFTVDKNQTRRKVADMTGDDHTFVADQYQKTGRRAMLLDSFHRSIAKKVGKSRTADVMSEEQYELLFNSIVVKAA